jgi:hypothetical protein
MVPAVSLGAHASAFAVPGVGGGGDLAVVGRFDRASLGIEGRFDSSLSGRAIDTGGDVHGSLWVVSLVPCWEPGLPFVCAIGSAGRFRGGSTGVSEPRTDAGAVIAAGVRAGVLAGLGERFALRAHLDLLRTLTPLALELDGRKVWETEAGSAVVGVSVLAIFP